MKVFEDLVKTEGEFTSVAVGVELLIRSIKEAKISDLNVQAYVEVVEELLETKFKAMVKRRRAREEGEEILK